MLAGAHGCYMVTSTIGLHVCSQSLVGKGFIRKWPRLSVETRERIDVRTETLVAKMKPIRQSRAGHHAFFLIPSDFGLLSE